ncbi:MAG: hypothetical protein AAGF01_18630 [Cyanobacteria bacterium P01_G01_bin.38]
MKSFFYKTCGLSIVMGLVAAPAALAQSSNNASDLFNQDNEAQSGEVFSGSGVDFGELIHRANRAGGLSDADYRQQQERNFNEATADYLQRRQEVLQQPAADTPGDDDSVEVGL